MSTKYLMISSAAFMALTGLAATFLPQEFLSYAGLSVNEAAAVFIQITGALYLGFAMMNWMAKTVLIGGIYARPLAMGNFLHFAAGATALIKFALNNSSIVYLWIATICYVFLAILFGKVIFTSPAKTTKA